MSWSLASLLAVLALLLLSMAVYTLRGMRRDADAEGKNAQFLGGLADFVLHWFLWLVAPAATLSIRLGLTADFYNFAGRAFGAAAGLAVASGRLEIAGWALVLSGVCDILDGRIARATGAASRYGAFIDSLLDRYIELFFFVGFAFFARHTGPGGVAATLAPRELGPRELRASHGRVARRGVHRRTDAAGRAPRPSLPGLAADPAASAALGLPRGALLTGVVYFIGATSLATAVHRTVWIACRLRTSSRREMR